MNYQSYLLLSGVGALLGCQSGPADFILANGTYGNGSPFHMEHDFKRQFCDRGAQAGCIALEGRELTVSTGDQVMGLRIEYLPEQMQGQTSFSSGFLPIEPVSVMVVRPDTGPHGDLIEGYYPIQGGQIQFTSIGAGQQQLTAGTFQGMTLATGSAVVLKNLSGSFSFFFPEPASLTGGPPVLDGGAPGTPGG